MTLQWLGERLTAAFQQSGCEPLPGSMQQLCSSIAATFQQLCNTVASTLQQLAAGSHQLCNSFAVAVSLYGSKVLLVLLCLESFWTRSAAAYLLHSTAVVAALPQKCTAEQDVADELLGHDDDADVALAHSLQQLTWLGCIRIAVTKDLACRWRIRLPEKSPALLPRHQIHLSSELRRTDMQH